MPQSETTAQPGGGLFCTLRDGVPCSPYGPHDQVSVTMTVEEWESVRYNLQCAADRQHGSMVWWRDFCKDKKMGAATAAQYEKAAAELERLAKIIEGTLYPAPPPKTE